MCIHTYERMRMRVCISLLSLSLSLSIYLSLSKRILLCIHAYIRTCVCACMRLSFSISLSLSNFLFTISTWQIGARWGHADTRAMLQPFTIHVIQVRCSGVIFGRPPTTLTYWCLELYESTTVMAFLYEMRVVPIGNGRLEHTIVP